MSEADGMKRLSLAGLLVALGCSGPISLDRAIWPQHAREYSAVMSANAPTPRDAWYAHRATTEVKSVDEIRRTDEALSPTRNPFDARKDGEAVSRGAVLFRENCARCHGADVAGHGPDMLAAHPTKSFRAFDKRFAVTLHGGAPRTWFEKISEGYGDEVAYPQGTSRAMPAFGEVLAREQIWLVITYLQSLDVYARPPPETQATTHAD
jgi:mono/diheme cytochrome c family protein